MLTSSPPTEARIHARKKDYVTLQVTNEVEARELGSSRVTGGCYALRFENRHEIAKLKPVPTPGNDDYQD